MRLIFAFIILSLICFALSATAQENKDLQTLQQNIENTFAQQKGEFAVAFKDLQTGQTLLINEHNIFHAASTMKTPVMLEIFAQAEAGKFLLTDSIIIKNNFKSIVDGSPFGLDSTDIEDAFFFAHIGEKITLDSLVFRMITLSSNLATNMLIETAGAENVTAAMRAIGANDIRVLRGVEDQKAFDKGLNNVTSAYDLMLLFEKIAEGKAVNPKASKAMTDILSKQRFNDVIPPLLPKNAKIAHKTGWITGVVHDSGIVFLPNGRKYVLVLLSQHLKDETSAKLALNKISKMIYDFVAEK
jgi:beta-lactamase class A